MNAALYSRCSTSEQSPEMQLNELRDYCRRRQFEIVGEYVDSAASGSRESRPELNKMMKDARRRRFDAVIVYRYDRFARSLRQLVNALAEFDSLGINFVSLHECVDTSTPNGKLVFGIFASIAEFERQLIIARTRSGMEAARRRGVKIGRPRVEVDVALIRALRAEGKTWDLIADQTKSSRATCQRACAAAAD